MAIIIIIVFVLGYAAIALEHNIKIDKAASALITGVVCWALYVFSIDASGHDVVHIIEHGIETITFKNGLIHHLYEIASILFFLMGAMTIVEMVDAHEGFTVITDRITTTNKTKLLWIICILTFFFSAALDNLTTTIVMISLLRKLIKDKETRWVYVGMVVLAANAAMAMAAAVLRATGSSKTVPCTLEACMASATRNRCSSEATQMTFLLRGETRSSVSCSRLLLSMSGTNCLGKLLRLSGQRRVPEPPQRTTGVISVIVWAAFRRLGV